MRLPDRFRTLSFKLTGVFLALSILLVALIALIVMFDVQSTLDDQIRLRVTDATRLLVDEYEERGLGSVEEIIRAQGSVVGALEYRLERPDGQILVGDLPPSPRRPGWTTLRLPVGAVPGGDPDASALVLSTILGGGEKLVVGEGLNRIGQARQAVLKAFATAMVVVLILSGLGASVLNALFVRRIGVMAQAARGVMAGDLSRRIPNTGSADELGALATVFNHMLDRTVALVELNRQIGADLAHDLRSPLSHLLQRLERARSRASAVAEYEEAVEGAVADVNQVLATFNAILRIAQVEAGTRKAGFKQLDLVETARNVVDAFVPVALDEGKAISLSGADAIGIVGDRELLTQLFANLVENAIRHTPAGTRIELMADGGRDPARVTVSDSGPGIPAADRARVLERFARLDRSRSTPGSGLGLTLCAAIADLHEGTLRLEDNGPGLRCVLELPLRSDPRET